jgi:hypothetical protein
MSRYIAVGIIVVIVLLGTLTVVCVKVRDNRITDDEQRRGCVQALDAALELAQITQSFQYNSPGTSDLHVTIEKYANGWLACVVFGERRNAPQLRDFTDAGITDGDTRRREFVHALDAALAALAKKDYQLWDRKFRIGISEYCDPGETLGDHRIEPSSGWFVLITFLPLSPGCDLAVTVTRDGEVSISGNG